MGVLRTKQPHCDPFRGTEVSHFPLLQPVLSHGGVTQWKAQTCLLLLPSAGSWAALCPSDGREVHGQKAHMAVTVTAGIHLSFQMHFMKCFDLVYASSCLTSMQAKWSLHKHSYDKRTYFSPMWERVLCAWQAMAEKAPVVMVKLLVCSLIATSVGNTLD